MRRKTRLKSKGCNETHGYTFACFFSVDRLNSLDKKETNRFAGHKENDVGAGAG
jgi:hypothetical protein